MPRGHRKSFWQHHSLSIAAGAILALWIVLYIPANERTHWGSFFGNAIADWTGMVIMVMATKWLYERGSRESRKPPRLLGGVPEGLRDVLRDHDLTIFIVLTGGAWVYAFSRMDPNSKWGQVVGNIVSEWTQILGVVLLTKFLVERGSKESG
jgi:hypothetical protein